MIQFSKLGEWGRFGNQLYQLAFLEALSKKSGTPYRIPKWKYSQYFEYKFPEVDSLFDLHLKLKEGPYKYQEGLLDDWSQILKTSHADILGYFQHVEYFKDIDVKELFKLKPEIFEKIKSNHPHLFNKPIIAVGVRRTDYTTSGSYYQLPINYYLLALQKFDYKNCNIVFITDDLPWCRFHFKGLENAYFPEFESDVEQFAFGTMADEGWIIANSTFHWWASYLSNVKKVIQPSQLFAGDLLKREGDENFYIQDDKFEIFDHADRKIDLRDVTFTIPTSFDHNDRKHNLELIVCLLQRHFDTNIIVGEQGGEKFEFMSKFCKYVKFPYEKFHRTKMLNEMAKIAETPIVVNWDTDVMVSASQILQSVEWIRSNMAHFVYPYEFQFTRIPKTERSKIYPNYDLAVFKDLTTGVDSRVRPSVGGAIFCNKQKFFEAGGENENFISYGPEDVERFERFTRLGYAIKRTKGNIYHFDHHIGPNSSLKNPAYDENVMELLKVREIHNLRKYVDGWSWANAYLPSYFDAIFDTKSRDGVFDVLFEHSIIKQGDQIIDVGCAQGQWGVDIKSKYSIKYTGMDLNVPKEHFKGDGTYLNQDLRDDFLITPTHTYDLAICLEVAEHIEEQYAEQLIKNLTKLSEQILFSAAIPGQGGLRHICEQWQSYWVSLFKKNDYYLSLWQPRSYVLHNKNIAYYYRQNMLFFQKADRLHGESLNGESVLQPYLDYVLPNNLR